MPALPLRVYTDRGGEFCSKEIEAYFRKKGVLIHHSAHSDIKAAVAERSIRTVKQRLYRYFEEYATKTWVDVIADISHAINRAHSRVTGLRPVDVTPTNAQAIWEKVYGKNYWKERDHALPAYLPGDYVRVAKEKTAPGTFKKGYLPAFTDKIYQVENVERGLKPLMYDVHAAQGQDDTVSAGRHYKEELARVRQFAGGFNMIEKVLRMRKAKDGGEKEFYVKFFRNDHPVWVTESSIRPAAS